MTYITDIKQAQTLLTQNDIKLITFENTICLDSGLSQIYFDEFISNASGCNDVQLFDSYLVIYGDDVNKHDKHFTNEEIALLNDNELMELYESLGLYYYDLDSKEELIDELLSINHEDYYKAYYAETDYRDLDYSFDFNGYSQGDYYKVQTVGKVQPWMNSGYLTNIFYDSPITGTITVYINGDEVNEICLYEFIQDEYAYWDKDKFILQCAEYIKDLEYKDLLLEYLEDELSDNLEYSY